MVRSIILCAVLLLSVCQAVVSDVVVETALGLVVGERTTEQFTTFLGIPYGRVDNSNPFSAAVTAPSFSTPYQAKQDPPLCPQININGEIDGDINCLNLNIITPNDVTTNSDLPVMVFIHGGAFVEGTGNLGTYSPKFLIQHDVIYVSVNYRLGVYGFLCLPELGYSNQGLQDIILALKWVKDHIKNFGGDEENILLFGHSAGSAAADLVLQYNDDNVFNKIILQSAQVAAPLVAGVPSGEDYIATVAQRLNIQATQTSDIMTQLSAINTDVLIDITRSDRFIPCIDSFFTNVAKKDNYKDMKIMVGATDKDILFMYYRNPSTDQDKISGGLNNKFVNVQQSAIDTVLNYYMVENDHDIVEFGTDYFFQHPIERSARFYRENNATVYRFVFSYDGDRNFLKMRDNVTGDGAIHGDELGYLFDMDLFGEITEEDQYVVDAMVEMWTNFAKYGDPTPASFPIITWPELDDDTNIYMDIEYPLTLLNHPYEDRTVFWDQFYQRYEDNMREGFDFLQSSGSSVNVYSGLLIVNMFLILKHLCC